MFSKYRPTPVLTLVTAQLLISTCWSLNWRHWGAGEPFGHSPVSAPLNSPLTYKLAGPEGGQGGRGGWYNSGGMGVVFCQPTVKIQKLKLIFRNNKLGVYEVPRREKLRVGSIKLTLTIRLYLELRADQAGRDPTDTELKCSHRATWHRIYKYLEQITASWYNLFVARSGQFAASSGNQSNTKLSTTVVTSDLNMVHQNMPAQSVHLSLGWRQSFIIHLHLCEKV